MNSSMVAIARNSILALALMFLVNLPVRADDSAGLYKKKCAMCHAADGSGNVDTGKKLGVKDQRSDEIQKLTDAQLNEDITNGVGKKMPAYKDKLTDAEIKGLVSYIRELGKKKS